MGSVSKALPPASRSSDCGQHVAAVDVSESSRNPEFRSCRLSSATLRCCRKWLLQLLQSPCASFQRRGRLLRSIPLWSCVSPVPPLKKNPPSGLLLYSWCSSLLLLLMWRPPLAAGNRPAGFALHRPIALVR